MVCTHISIHTKPTTDLTTTLCSKPIAAMGSLRQMIFGMRRHNCSSSKELTRLKLRIMQNRAARAVLNAPPCTPSLLLLQQLHWLPIEARISYKLCSLIYRVVHGSAPAYLTELCQLCSDTRLRSTSRGDFIVPRLTANFQTVFFPLLHHLLGIASRHTFAPHPHTHFS